MTHFLSGEMAVCDFLGFVASFFLSPCNIYIVLCFCIASAYFCAARFARARLTILEAQALHLTTLINQLSRRCYSRLAISRLICLYLLNTTLFALVFKSCCVISV